METGQGEIDCRMSWQAALKVGAEAQPYNLRWEYIGEELAIFWDNPYEHKKEKIASFWWPTHPVEKTGEVEKLFEMFASKMCAKAED